MTYLKGGKEYFQPAKVVMLSTYMYENVRLLLLSKSKAYPNGLSNNHGQVGKHYIGHGLASASVMGVFPGRRLNLYSGTIASTRPSTTGTPTTSTTPAWASSPAA